MAKLIFRISINRDGTITIPKRIRIISKVECGSYLDIGIELKQHNMLIFFDVTENYSGKSEVAVFTRKVTSRSTITIPKNLMRAYDLLPGTTLQLRFCTEKKHGTILFKEKLAVQFKKLYANMHNWENKHLWGTKERFIEL